MTPFKDMAKFLRESRISKALTDRTIVYESHVRMFWKSVRYDDKEKMIYSAVQKKDDNDKDIDVEVKFNVGDVRRVLDLRDSDDDPIIVPKVLCKGLWFRMGFSSHVNDKYLKSKFCRPYKFLVHCVIHALSHRKGAYDEPSDYIMNIITYLVLSRPYNISQVIFDHMVDDIRGEKYIMYPRFIQMLIDDQVKDLVKDSEDVLDLHHMTAETLSILNQYKLKKDESKPRVKKMICKIANPSYVAPENDAWRHENNNLEDETERLSEMHEKKLRCWFVKDGKRKRTPKASPTVTAPKVTPKIVVKGPSKKSPPRLVDEPMLDPADVIQQGVGLMKESLESFLKKNEEATTAKDQGSSVEKAAESSVKHVQAKSLKEKEPEGVAHTDSSDANDESTDTEPEIDTSKIGVGKVTLKKKPHKKKKDSDEEDSTYIPTPEESETSKEAQSSGDDDEVVITDERVSTPPPPENPTIHIPDDAETSKPKKITPPGLFEGFPNIHGELKDDILPNEDYDKFHDATIKDLTKKVSLLEKQKAKAKAEVECDELKKQLEKIIKVNEEMKAIINDHAERINTLVEDVDDNAKLFEQVFAELSEVNVKYVNMNETN
ncbi:putative transcription factor bZIP family [Helianthus anomalus]